MDNENQVKESTVEIPMELEGVSPEVAAEIVKEAGAANADEDIENAREPEVENQGEGATKEKDKTDDKDTPVDDPLDEVQNDVDAKKPPESIPYVRFKELNDKKNAKEKENAQLRAELETFKKEQQEQIPPAEHKPQTNEQAYTPPYLQPSFLDMVRIEARNRAKLATGFTAEQIAEFETDYAEDTPEKRKWENSIQAQTPLVAVEARELMRQREVQANEQQRVHQMAYDEYIQLAETINGWQDKEAVWNHVSGNYLTKLSEVEQIALKSAYANAESGRGSMQDIQFVKHHLYRAAEEYRSIQKKPETPAEKPNKAKKIEQMKAHPRTDQIAHGDNDPEGTTLADIEKMLNDPNVPMDKIPPEIRKMLLV